MSAPSPVTNETPTALGGRFVMRRSRGTARRHAPGTGSDRAPARPASAGDRAHDEDRDDRADRRNDDRRDVDPCRVIVAGQDAGQETADECADDTQDDVSDDTETLVTLDEEPGEISGDRANDDPRNDAHSKPPSQVRASHPLAGVVWCIPRTGIRLQMSPRRYLGRTTFGGSCVTTDYKPIRPRKSTAIHLRCARIARVRGRDAPRW